MPAQFHDQNDIYAVFLAGANLIDGVWGFGWPIYGWGNGGVALMAENAPIGVDLVVHELLHTFGLYHEIPAIIPEFQEVKYRWLDKHHYFNSIFEIRDVPTVSHVDIKGVIRDKKYVQFEVAVSSRIGLHQSLLWRGYDWGIVGWDVEVSGLSDTSIIEVPFSWLTETDAMWFQILDIHGNHWMHQFDFEAPDFEPKPTSVGEGTHISTTWAKLKGD